MPLQFAAQHPLLVLDGTKLIAEGSRQLRIEHIEACVRLHLTFGALSFHSGDKLPRLLSLGKLLVKEEATHLAAGQAKAVGNNHTEIIPVVHGLPCHCTPRSITQQDGPRFSSPLALM